MRRRQSLAASLTVALGIWAAASPAQGIANASFEEAQLAGGALRPIGWSLEGRGYDVVVDTTVRADSRARSVGRSSLRSWRAPVAADLLAAAPSGGSLSSWASQTMAPGRARGRGLRLTAWIRTEGVVRGSAGLWIWVVGDRGTLWRVDLGDRAPRGTTPWTRYAIEVPIDTAATRVSLGTIHTGAGTAWFDGLTLDVVDVPTPAPLTADAFVPPPRQADDFTRLLSDAELALPADSAMPAVDSAAAGWVRAHARPIRSLGATDFTDLAFLDTLLARKRIVQLGESGHGVREFNLAKVRLIRYLHERLGYDVLAFENSLYACEHVGARAATLTAQSLMKDCVGGVWGTQEVLPLLEYVHATQRTAHPLRLTGFDVQMSSRYDSTRSAFLRRVVEAAGELEGRSAVRAYARRVFDTDTAFRFAVAGGLAVLPAPARDRFVAFYDSLAQWLRPRERALASSFPDAPWTPMVARQVAVSLSLFARQRGERVPKEMIVHRDRGMADNLEFFLTERYPGEKMIVWAHNGHVRYGSFAPGVTADRRPDGWPRMMGTYVAERHRPEVYTLALYMYRGSAADLTFRTYEIAPPSPGSLEAILHRAPWRYTFVDFASAPAGPATAWMAGLIEAREAGRAAEWIVPRDEYDGVLFIDTTWPPSYVRPLR